MTSQTNPGTSAKRVLIIKLSALGDFVMALGAMQTVREHHPAAEITLLTTPFLKSFAEACPYFDRVETDGRPKGLRAQHALLRRISKARYDMVYDFQTSNRTNTYWKFLKRLPHFRTPPWSGAVERQPFFHADPLRHTMHPVDRLAAQLRYAGIELNAPPVPDLSWVRPALGDGPALQAAHFEISGKYALLIPGASAHRSAKRWPENRYGDLATRLLDIGITPVIIGGTSERDIGASIKLREPGAINLTSKTSLFQIVTLAERAEVVIGNDTGPMHMSTLAGAKGVALFATSESDPRQAKPRGAPVITVSASRADAISLDRVWRAVSVLLEHGDVPKQDLLQALSNTEHETSELRLLDGTELIGRLIDVTDETFEFSTQGPLAPDKPGVYQINDLDPFSIRYWPQSEKHAIDLLV